MAKEKTEKQLKRGSVRKKFKMKKPKFRMQRSTVSGAGAAGDAVSSSGSSGKKNDANAHGTRSINQDEFQTWVRTHEDDEIFTEKQKQKQSSSSKKEKRSSSSATASVQGGTHTTDGEASDGELSDEEGMPALCLHTYEPDQDDEIPLRKNEVITVYDRDPSGWWTGETPDGNYGLFPGAFVRLLDAGEQTGDLVLPSSPSSSSHSSSAAALTDPSPSSSSAVSPSSSQQEHEQEQASSGGGTDSSSDDSAARASRATSAVDSDAASSTITRRQSGETASITMAGATAASRPLVEKEAEPKASGAVPDNDTAATLSTRRSPAAATDAAGSSASELKTTTTAEPKEEAEQSADYWKRRFEELLADRVVASVSPTPEQVGNGDDDDDQLSALRNENADLVKQLRDLQEQVTELTLAQELQQWKRGDEEDESATAVLKNSSSVEDVERLQAQILEQKRTIDSLRARLAELETAAAAPEDARASADAGPVGESTSDQDAALQSRLSKLEQEIADLKVEHELEQEQLQDLNSSLQAELDELNAELGRLRNNGAEPSSTSQTSKGPSSSSSSSASVAASSSSSSSSSASGGPSKTVPSRESPATSFSGTTMNTNVDSIELLRKMMEETNSRLHSEMLELRKQVVDQRTLNEREAELARSTSRTLEQEVMELRRKLAEQEAHKRQLVTELENDGDERYEQAVVERSVIKDGRLWDPINNVFLRGEGKMLRDMGMRKLAPNNSIE